MSLHVDLGQLSLPSLQRR